jgi:hypothetical protein
MAVKLREKNGKWWLFVDWRGQRKKKCVGSKEAAEKAKIMLEARLVLGAKTVFEPASTPEPPPSPLFGEYFRTWLDTYAKLTCKESTWKSYNRDFRLYLEPAFGQAVLTEISRDKIIDRLIHPLLTHERVLPNGKEAATTARGEHRRRRVSRGTVKNALAALRGCLNHAVEAGRLAANPPVRLPAVDRHAAVRRAELHARDAGLWSRDRLSLPWKRHPAQGPRRLGHAHPQAGRPLGRALRHRRGEPVVLRSLERTQPPGILDRDAGRLLQALRPLPCR